MNRQRTITGNIDTFMRFPSNITLAANLGGTYDQLENSWGHAGDMWLSYLDNFMYLGLLQAVVSPDYLPRTGFVSRRDVIMTSPAGIPIDHGNYRYQQHEITFNTDTSAPAYLTVLAKHGGFHYGSHTQFNLGAGIRPIPNIAVHSSYN